MMVLRAGAFFLSVFFLPSVVLAASASLTAEEAAVAARIEPHGVVGEFTMAVCRTGHVNGAVFLDSRKNYRDQKTLIIEIPDTVVQRTGLTPEQVQERYLGRRIRVSGWARRVPIGVHDAQGNVVSIYDQIQVHMSTLDDVQLDGLQRDASVCPDDKAPQVS
nr:hypothetical protein [uncultured Neokomagataea sp.]